MMSESYKEKDLVSVMAGDMDLLSKETPAGSMPKLKTKKAAA